MPTFQDKITQLGLSTSAQTSLQQINTNSYETSQIQSNVQIFGDNIAKKVKQFTKLYTICYFSAESTDFSAGAVLYPNKLIDTMAMYQSGGLIASIEGFYLIFIAMTADTSTGTKISLYKNGSEASVIYNGGAASKVALSLTVGVYLNFGDILTVYLVSGSLTVYGSSEGLLSQFGAKYS